jgi:hypothetical protein
MNHPLNRWAWCIAVGLLSVPVASFAAAPTITSFTPVSGPIGTKVVVTGTNLSTPTAVTVDGTAASFTGSTATRLTVTVPATGTGPIAVTTAGGTGTSSAMFTVTPGVTLLPTTGHPNLAVTLTGSGFGPYTSVDVYFDTIDTALAVSNALGVVSITVQVPASSQPGTHWFTLDERANHYAAQAAFTVNTNWIMEGFSPTNSGVNPFENTINANNVGQLDTSWGTVISSAGNPNPILVLNGNVFTINEEGLISALNATGKLIWTANVGNFVYAQPSPVTSSGLVIFGTGSSLYAFKTNCRSDGGTCTPTWVKSLGSVTVSAGLTLFKGIVYVPGSDGNIYPVTPATGALGTPFFAVENDLGAVTTPVVFEPDGSFYYATTSAVQFKASYGGGYEQFYGSGVYVSPITLNAGHAYFTTSDGMAHRFGGWNQPTSGTYCYSAPVVANNLVIAAGCSSLTAFEASGGATQWSLTPGLSGVATGLSVANGVLYGCIGGSLSAYYLSYGEQLWSGGDCNSQPVIVNGTVYATDATLAAYTVPGLSSDALHPKPEAYELKPDLGLAPQQTPEQIHPTPIAPE